MTNRTIQLLRAIGSLFLLLQVLATVQLNGQTALHPAAEWIKRADLITERFHQVYTPTWEGANGAIGDAFLYSVTRNEALRRFHLQEHDLRSMENGTWVDDRAWVCLAELYWWQFTGRTNKALVVDAQQRYLSARAEGRLSSVEGFWTWYNWPPHLRRSDRIFTNSNMNQMAHVACRLYEATGDRRFLKDALLVWEGDSTTPGIERTLYRGNGVWQGRPGRAAFGKELPWEGMEYCSFAAALYRITKREKFRTIIVATTRRLIDPATGWLDAVDRFQIRMDGNGAFVQYLMDAYAAAPVELAAVPGIVETMLEHVWTNFHGRAQMTLHRTSDHAIRNGWNPYGGEDGYGVDEIGTVHAQSQAARAFGVFVGVTSRKRSR